MDNRNKDRQEQIGRYLFEEMDQVEKGTFEQELKDNQELREDVELSRHIMHAFQHEGEQAAFEAMKSMPEKDFKELIVSRRTVDRKKQKQTLTISLSVAIAAVVLLFLYIGTRPHYTSEELYTRYYTTQAYVSSSIRGSIESTIEYRIKKSEAGKRYEQKEYAQALILFNQLFTETADWQSQPEDLLFYTAICQFETGHPDNAIEKLTFLASSAQSEFQDEALWNLVFIYLKENQRGKAKKTLWQLIEKDSDYADNAREIMEKLNQKLWF